MRIGIAAVALVVSACAYQRQVPSSQLATLQRPGHGDAVVMKGRLLRARLTPVSRIRFQRDDGAWSPWLGAANLMVDARGVYVHGAVEVSDAADAVRIDGLDQDGRRALARTRPDDATLRPVDDGFESFEMRATGPVLRAWVDAFINEIARQHDPASPRALCGPDQEPAPACDLGEYDDRARGRLYQDLHGRPLGSWSFHVPGRGWLPALAGEDLYRTLDRWATRVGWSWDRMKGAQVESLSGMRSLAVGVVAGTVLGPLAWLQDRTGEAPSAPSDAVIDAALETPMLDFLSLVPLRNFDDEATWAPEVADREALDARPLFTGRAVRRANVLTVIAADALATFPRPDREMEGVTIAARLGELAEIGVGVRRLAGRGLEEPGRWTAVALWSFYVGGHFFVDAHQRFALPVGVEVGGSSAGGYWRARWGVRARVIGDWFAGIYPLNPTFTGVDVPDDTKPLHDDMPIWSFPSGVELGIAF